MSFVRNVLSGLLGRPMSGEVATEPAPPAPPPPHQPLPIYFECVQSVPCGAHTVTTATDDPSMQYTHLQPWDTKLFSCICTFSRCVNRCLCAVSMTVPRRGSRGGGVTARPPPAAGR